VALAGDAEAGARYYRKVYWRGPRTATSPASRACRRPAAEMWERCPRSLLRVVILLSRYLQDTTTAFSDQPASAPAPAGPWGRAREALHNAAGFLLHSGTPRPPGPPAPPPRPSSARATGVTATAERARHTTRQPPGSPALTVTSLRHIAETATVTSHHCALLATTLTRQATGTPYRDAADSLDATAQAARHATRTWYQTAQALRGVTTDTRGQLTPAAAEAAQLAWWTGRLTYTDPPGTSPPAPTAPCAHPTNSPPLQRTSRR
jgi:hypothetical protein